MLPPSFLNAPRCFSTCEFGVDRTPVSSAWGWGLPAARGLQAVTWQSLYQGTRNREHGAPVRVQWPGGRTPEKGGHWSLAFPGPRVRALGPSPCRKETDLGATLTCRGLAERHLQAPGIGHRGSQSTAACSCQNPHFPLQKRRALPPQIPLCYGGASLSFAPTLFSPPGAFPWALTRALYLTSDLCSVP